MCLTPSLRTALASRQIDFLRQAVFLQTQANVIRADVGEVRQSLVESQDEQYRRVDTE
jgi:hypothetical protein